MAFNKTAGSFESTEGGEAKYYYQKNKLEKIITRIFGESGQILTEYYLLNGQLSFVYEKTINTTDLSFMIQRL